MTGPTSREAEPPYAWVVVWATFLGLAVIFGVSYSFAAFFESFAGQFNAQRADVSLVFGVSGLVYFLFGAAGGLLADRFGPRAVTSAGMLCIAGGLLASSFAGSMTTIYLAYGVGVGIGIALVYTPSIGCVQPWFTTRRGLVAGMTLRQTLASAEFRWLYFGTVVAAPTMFIPFAHVSAAARDLGIADAQAVGLVGLIGIGSLTGRFAIGALADRVGRPLTLVLAQAAMGAAYLLWMAAGGYPMLAVFALVFGLSYGGIVSLLPALCMDFFGARAVSGIIGTLYTGAALGNLAGPWLAGRVFDLTGGYGSVLWGCMALSALATFASARLLQRRTSSR
jgi:MFS family permease